MQAYGKSCACEAYSQIIHPEMHSPPHRRSAPVVGFALSGESPVRERGRGVPARSAPPPLTDHVIEKGHRRRRPSFDEHIRPIDADAAATADAPPEPTPDLPEGLAEILDALQQSFVQIAYLLRHGLRSEEDLPGSSSSTSLPESLVTGRSAGEVTILQAMADAAAARSKPGFRSRGLHGRTTATRETIRGMRQDETSQFGVVGVGMDSLTLSLPPSTTI